MVGSRYGVEGAVTNVEGAVIDEGAKRVARDGREVALSHGESEAGAGIATRTRACGDSSDSGVGSGAVVMSGAVAEPV